MPVNSFNNPFYPMANAGLPYAPGYPYGQTLQPYVPTATYPQTQTPNQAQQSQMRPQSIMGRMVSNPNEITPQEIPMDGTISMFPMQDGSAVYGKFWNSNGQIKTIRFIPEDSEQPMQQDPLDAINGRLDTIEELVRSIGSTRQRGQNSKRQNGGDSNAES